MTTILRKAVLMTAAMALLGCNNESLMSPNPTAGGRFARYVAMGNSLTAGFQSGGINDSTQVQSYAMLVANQMGTTFNMPLLNRPGCPGPYTNVFIQARVGGASAPPCALRASPPPTFLNDVAVPGAGVTDILTNIGPGTAANALTTFILGGRTQFQAAAAVQPTFVSAWIGNNEVLGAALSGDGSQIMPSATFTTNYKTITDSISALNVQGAILLGVVKVTSIPYLSAGAVYFGAKLTGALPPTFNVSPNCAPTSSGGVGDQMLVPFQYGFGVLLAQASAGTPVTLDCVNQVTVNGLSILTQGEVASMLAAVTAYNATISAQAQAKGWAYLDISPVLDSLKSVGEIPLFPNAPPSPLAVTQPFGKWFSLDGVHASALGHKLIANRVIAAINAKYGSSIAPVP
jgi:hypothetical protein